MNDDHVLVSVRSVSLRFGPASVLAGIDLDVAAGDQIALTGRSGSGKTSLLMILAGLVAPTSGSTTWPGLGGDPHAVRREIGMVFQAPSLVPELSALENVTLPLRFAGQGVEESRSEAVRALAVVDASDLADALPSQLSGGQQQRVAVARALAGRHRLILADEPTGSLDRAHALEVAVSLREAVRRSGGAIVVATHDEDLAALFERRVDIVDGRSREGMRAS